MFCNIEKGDFLYFQVLLSFVPTIFHFLDYRLFRLGKAAPHRLAPRRFPVSICDNVSTR